MIKVNNHVISEKEFDLACNDFKRRLRTSTLRKDYVESVKDQLIEARLLIDAAKDENIEIDDNEINEIYSKIISNFPSEADFIKMLEGEGDNVESLKDKIREDIILKKFITTKFVNETEVPESEIESYYNENKNNFKVKGQVKASHILFDNDKLELAETVKKEIQSGADFAEMAKKHSKCPSKDAGGDLGYFTKGQMVPEFEKAAFGSELGIVTGPVKTQFGYHLITVFDKKGEKDQTLDDVREELTNHLKNTLVNYKIDTYASDLRKNATITVDTEKIELRYDK